MGLAAAFRTAGPGLGAPGCALPPNDCALITGAPTAIAVRQRGPPPGIFFAALHKGGTNL
jgi:hypothetical protein